MTALVQINVPGNHLMAGLLGERDQYLKEVERSFDATIHGHCSRQVGVEPLETLFVRT